MQRSVKALIVALAALGPVLCATGCGSRFTREDLQRLDARSAVLVIVEPSAIPKFEQELEVRPEDVVREARVLANDLSYAPGGKKAVPAALRTVAPGVGELVEASEVLADQLAGRFSRGRLLRPPPSECVLHGAAPAIPGSCQALPHALRVQVRSIRFTASPGELRLVAFIARSALVDRATGRLLWTSQCNLLPVELPNVPGARRASEVNQILERAAQVCADKLELDLRHQVQRAR